VSDTVSSSTVPGSELHIDFQTLKLTHDFLQILAAASGYEPGSADVEVELPPWESKHDPSLQDAIGKALEAGYGNVVGMTIEIKKKGGE